MDGDSSFSRSSWMMGDFKALRGATLEVMHRYDPSKHSESAHTYVGHDSLVCARSLHSTALWALGFPAQAHEAARRAIDDARHVNHQFTLAHGLAQAAITFQLLRDRDACLGAVEEAIAVAERNGFPWPLEFSRFCQGLVRCLDGDADTGIAAMLNAAKHPSGPNLTFRFAWGFSGRLACASLRNARANQHSIECRRPQRA